MVAISKLSKIVELTRSQVTAPPNLIPAIQSGSGMMGKVKRLVPGTGTPITIPIKTLNTIIASDNFNAKLKLPAHGPSLLKFFTISEMAISALMLIRKLSRRTKLVATNIADSHQVRGWSAFISLLSQRFWGWNFCAAFFSRIAI